MTRRATILRPSRNFTATPSVPGASAAASARRMRPPLCSKWLASVSVATCGSPTVIHPGTNVAATSASLKPGWNSAMASGPRKCVNAMPWSARACHPGCDAASSASLSYRCRTPSPCSMWLAPASPNIRGVSIADRSIIAACATVLARTRSGMLARQKRISHGAMRGRYVGRIVSGPSGSSSQRGALRRIPGEASGRMSENASAPALPRLAPDATPSRSISTTSRPSCCRRSAIATPTMPAPITSTSHACRRFSRQRRRVGYAKPHANLSAGSKTTVASSVTCARPCICGSTAFAGTPGSGVAARA